MLKTTRSMRPPAQTPEEENGCAFILDPLDGGCGRPAICSLPRRPGSSYCPAHHALCYLPPESVAERQHLLVIEALAEAVGGKAGGTARCPPPRLLRRLDRVSRAFSSANRSRIVLLPGESRNAAHAHTPSNGKPGRHGPAP